ncbi:carbohydrate reductase-like protein [Haloferax elongans ATCC BAA-1513]|uniref:Carbohydrate reductase-like protein n=1 Tax=Haloferax elongans ATCC BAA-1513 TaxID=1230453 RepID=M0HMT8_HALEO|nr:sugar nucleotide-binding protein [Haloferax elongans]ELZ85905.1 carbohydrate reductase-like protein [Haloferax elongans ATCC BAA-1513]
MNTQADIFVVGANGYVGSAVADRLAADGASVTGTYHSTPGRWGHRQFDFWSDDPSRLAAGDCLVFASTVERDDRPLDEFEARVGALTDACSGLRFVYVSTDSVFGGESGWYSEDEPTAPRSHYGRRSARFETLVEENCTDYCIVRPSYVYGYSGGELDSRLAQTFRSLRSGEVVRYYDDYFKSPVEVNQLAAILSRVCTGGFQGTLHVGGPRMSVFEFHRRAASAFGVSPDRVEPASMPAESSLPTDTSLDSSRVAREFGLRPAPVVESLTCSSVDDVLATKSE